MIRASFDFVETVLDGTTQLSSNYLEVAIIHSEQSLASARQNQKIEAIEFQLTYEKRVNRLKKKLGKKRADKLLKGL